MKGLVLNLSTQPFRNRTPLFAGLGALALFAVGGAVWNAWSFFSTSAQAARAGVAIEESDRRLEALAQKRVELDALLQGVNLKEQNRRIGLVNGLLLRRGFSWTRLFNELESAIPYDVRMNAIRPIVTGNEISIVISGEAKRVEDVYELEEKLEGSPLFSDAYPSNEQRTERGMYSFDVRVRYHPGAAPLHAAALPAAVPLAPLASPAAPPGPEPVPSPERRP